MKADTGRALEAVMERVAVTAAEVGPRFPLYADPADGRWTTTGRGSWTGGFWAGLLRLRARCTGAESDRRAAAACTARLAPWTGADTATRGLILWYGTAAADDDTEAAALRARAARSCLADCEPELGILPWGGALGGPRLLARVDGVPGTVPLLAEAGPRGAAAAAAHLHRHLDLCLGGPAGAARNTPGGPHQDAGEDAAGVAASGAVGGADAWFRPALRFETATARWVPCEDPAPGWSRGRAWLLLALADALLRPAVAAHDRARLDVSAALLLDRGGMLTGPPVPPADAARPDGPLDTSAAAVTAVALLKLARTPGARAEQYALRAAEILDHLIGHHLTGGGGGRPSGMLLDGCYDATRPTALRHELVWGDYFLALGLAALHGAADLTRI